MVPRTRDSIQHIHNITLTIELSHHKPTTLYTIRKPQSLLQCRSMITISQCPNLQVFRKEENNVDPQRVAESAYMMLQHYVIL